MSLLLEKRKSANMLIEAVTSGRVLPMPSSLASVTECFSLLNRTFPELLLNLVTEMPLDHGETTQDGRSLILCFPVR